MNSASTILKWGKEREYMHTLATISKLRAQLSWEGEHTNHTASIDMTNNLDLALSSEDIPMSNYELRSKFGQKHCNLHASFMGHAWTQRFDEYLL